MNFELKKYRNSKGLTQVQFAKKIGVSDNFICMIETDIKPVSRQLLQKIANAFQEEIIVKIKPS